jgi:hypothetical protein
METAIIALVLISIAALAVFIWAMGVRAERKRREALASLAAAMRFSFSAEDPGYIPEEYGHIECFQRGRNNEAKNILSGESDGCAFKIFDYSYVTGSGKSRTTRRMNVCIADVPQRFPEVLIRPEGLFDKMIALVGFEDIDFSGTMEAHEFSKRFFVNSKDEDFTRKLLTQSIREALMRNQDLTVHVVSRAIAFVKEYQIQTSEFADMLATARHFVSSIPREASDRYMP